MFKHRITKEEVNLLPIVHFEGEITVVDNVFKVSQAIEELRKSNVVGIDTETKPSFTKGKHNKVSLIQISTLDRCFLFRLNLIGFPKLLIDFITDKNIKKVGLALRDDMSGLNKHHKIKPGNIIDLQSIVRNYGIMELSLQKIYAIVFDRKISKSQQLSNWENEELTDKQQIYAATDAWTCLQIYLQLMHEKPLSQREIEQIILEFGMN